MTLPYCIYIDLWCIYLPKIFILQNSIKLEKLGHTLTKARSRQERFEFHCVFTMLHRSSLQRLENVEKIPSREIPEITRFFEIKSKQGRVKLLVTSYFVVVLLSIVSKQTYLTKIKIVSVHKATSILDKKLYKNAHTAS